jgi:hypothetical protein
MPYINQARRNDLAPDIDRFAPVNAVGELNYVITCLVQKFLAQSHVGYTELNAAIGVLECAKLELYRRVVARYEDTKIKENGDVFPK